MNKTSKMPTPTSKEPKTWFKTCWGPEEPNYNRKSLKSKNTRLRTERISRKTPSWENRIISLMKLKSRNWTPLPPLLTRLWLCWAPSPTPHWPRSTNCRPLWRRSRRVSNQRTRTPPWSRLWSNWLWTRTSPTKESSDKSLVLWTNSEMKSSTVWTNWPPKRPKTSPTSRPELTNCKPNMPNSKDKSTPSMSIWLLSAVNSFFINLLIEKLEEMSRFGNQRDQDRRTF